MKNTELDDLGCFTLMLYLQRELHCDSLTQVQEIPLQPTYRVQNLAHKPDYEYVVRIKEYVYEYQGKETRIHVGIDRITNTVYWGVQQ